MSNEKSDPPSQPAIVHNTGTIGHIKMIGNIAPGMSALTNSGHIAGGEIDGNYLGAIEHAPPEVQRLAILMEATDRLPPEHRMAWLSSVHNLRSDIAPQRESSVSRLREIAANVGSGVLTAAVCSLLGIPPA